MTYTSSSFTLTCLTTTSGPNRGHLSNYDITQEENISSKKRSDQVLMQTSAKLPFW